MKLTHAELSRIRQRHRGYRITLLVQVGILLLLPLTQRLPGLLSLLLCLLAAVLLVFTSRFSPLRSSKRLIFGLGGLAISMEILWHGALILTPSLGRWLTFPHVLIWLLFLLTAVVRKVLTLTREPIVTTSVVLGAASGYFTLGIAGGILLGWFGGGGADAGQVDVAGHVLGWAFGVAAGFSLGKPRLIQSIATTG